MPAMTIPPSAEALSASAFRWLGSTSMPKCSHAPPLWDESHGIFVRRREDPASAHYEARTVRRSVPSATAEPLAGQHPQPAGSAQIPPRMAHRMGLKGSSVHPDECGSISACARIRASSRRWALAWGVGSRAPTDSGATRAATQAAGSASPYESNRGGPPSVSSLTTAWAAAI